MFQDNIFNQWIYNMNRRNFIKRVGLLGAGYALNKNLMFANSGVASTATSFFVVSNSKEAYIGKELQKSCH